MIKRSVKFSMDNEDTAATVIFSAASPEHGYELWKTDGTENGTTLIKDINGGTSSSSPFFLTLLNNQIYFSARSDDFGTELWKTDGSENGTILVKDINPGTNSSYPKNLVKYNDYLLFAADNKGYEIWLSDGTDSGTNQFFDIIPGPIGTEITNLYNCGGKVFYQGNTSNYSGAIISLDNLCCHKSFENTWIGPPIGNWYDDVSNWSRGIFPSSCDDLIISSNNKVILMPEHHGHCFTIDVKPGAQLDIIDNSVLDVNKN